MIAIYNRTIDQLFSSLGETAAVRFYPDEPSRRWEFFHKIQCDLDRDVTARVVLDNLEFFQRAQELGSTGWCFDGVYEFINEDKVVVLNESQRDLVKGVLPLRTEIFTLPTFFFDPRRPQLSMPRNIDEVYQILSMGREETQDAMKIVCQIATAVKECMTR